eukprot:5451003-Lingulodinium_polyedra.AAC.1
MWRGSFVQELWKRKGDCADLAAYRDGAPESPCTRSRAPSSGSSYVDDAEVFAVDPDPQRVVAK